MARAMILAAGFGTRLRPLTEELPKSLLPLGDRPVLAHVLEWLERAGLEGAVLNAHHLAGVLREYSRSCGFILHVEEEPEIRGTAGGVCGARAFLGRGPAIVLNADHVLDAPIDTLLSAADEHGFAMAVRLRPPGQGRVGVGADGSVVRLRDERVRGEEVHGADYVSVCALADRVLDALPQRGCLVGDVALPWLRRGERIVAVPVSGAIYSIGDSIAEYLDENQKWLEREQRDSYVGEGAVLAPGLILERSIVGAGAHLEGEGVVTRSVIWPGARAKAPLSGSVVTKNGHVV